MGFSAWGEQSCSLEPICPQKDDRSLNVPSADMEWMRKCTLAAKQFKTKTKSTVVKWKMTTQNGLLPGQTEEYQMIMKQMVMKQIKFSFLYPL